MTTKVMLIPGLLYSAEAAWTPEGSTILFWAAIEINLDPISGRTSALIPRITRNDSKRLVLFNGNVSWFVNYFMNRPAPSVAPGAPGFRCR